MIIIDRSRCCYCGTCVATCPNSNLELIDACLTMNADCKRCGICANICPVGALEVVHEHRL
ncbi:4Fe-4S ferredoxin iron-sulfur binding domain-containing protein [Methanofollis liminatans DSM 4140]|uniref:4Fe-4S ferredoxin iron-sulfur binding domain-containing protein n=1 Tax=Methanofollis liminatans DSM 4140 TaxID=28892 RepID=J1L0C5_9EURY|nr:4Fe-4S binding protein [Methanofollis liminatans]EJG06065.1 4Fe-4S ferredoxin iron-sulfur binding domain-containing protein [Methanofollis liminatans DSM 4140]